MEHAFVEAVAKEGRSYKKEIFENLAAILQRRALKTQGEIQQLVLFCQKVEETKAKIEAEEEGEDVRASQSSFGRIRALASMAPL